MNSVIDGKSKKDECIINYFLSIYRKKYYIRVIVIFIIYKLIFKDYILKNFNYFLGLIVIMVSYCCGIL